MIGELSGYFGLVYTVGIFVFMIFIMSQVALVWHSLVTGRVSQYLIQHGSRYSGKIGYDFRDGAEFIVWSVIDVMVTIAIGAVIVLALPLIAPIIIFYLSAFTVRKIINRVNTDRNAQ